MKLAASFQYKIQNLATPTTRKIKLEKNWPKGSFKKKLNLDGGEGTLRKKNTSSIHTKEANHII